MCNRLTSLLLFILFKHYTAKPVVLLISDVRALTVVKDFAMFLQSCQIDAFHFAVLAPDL